MKVRRLADLAQVSDAEFLSLLGEGASHSLQNAERLFADASTALHGGGRRGYLMLRNAAAEEAAKVLILLDAARCPRHESQDRGRQVGKFYDHLARMIYNEVADCRPADFRELERLVANLREEYYLDGPNGFDWIYRNRLLQEREGSMYVDFVETDGGRRWEVPNQALAELLTQGPAIAPGALRIARHLDMVGVLGPAGFQIAAEVWRETAPTPDTRWATFKERNVETIKRLGAGELMGAAKPENVAAICHHWPFPMWSLDMALIKVKFEDIQTARDELAARYPEGY